MPLSDALLSALKRRHPAHGDVLADLLPVLASDDPTPFLARYRRDTLRGLDPGQFQRVRDAYREVRELVRRRETALKALEATGTGCCEAVLKRMQTTQDQAFLEDVIRPLRNKKKAPEGVEDPVTSLADSVIAGTDTTALDELLAPFCGKDGAHPTPDDQRTRLLGLVAERLAACPARRRAVRNALAKQGTVVTSAARTKEVKDAYAAVAGVREPLGKIKPRNLLLLRRAQKAGAIKVSVEISDEQRAGLLAEHFVPAAEHPHADLVAAAGRKALNELVIPQLGGEAVLQKRRASERQLLPAIGLVLRERLMAPPAGAQPIVAVVPGATGACRIVAVDEQGRPGETAAVHPLPPRSEREAAAAKLVEIVTASGAKLVVVAGSRRARAVRQWVAQTLAAAEGLGAIPVPVHEGAAIAYAEAHPEIASELPSSVRAALSLGRFVQDPLRELVHYDLTRLPLDPNQRDLDQGELRRLLDQAVENAVAAVGVDLNSADEALLARVPGIDQATARAIIAYRTSHGPLRQRADLRQVEGVGEEAWQRAGGFLRVYGSPEPLDATGVHPTGAPLANALAAKLDSSVANLIGKPELLAKLDLSEFVSEAHTESDVRSVADELGYGGTDPREHFVPPAFNAGLNALRDLTEGQELSGVVRSVSDFGVFVDVGLRQEGLVHVSELAHQFVKSPADVITVGETVRVKVLSVDPQRRRISLSIKQLLPPPVAPERSEREGDGGGRGGFREGGRGGRGDRRGGPRGGPRRDGRERGGPQRSRAPAPRAMPKEGDPFHMQLNALRQQLGFVAPKPKQERKKKKRKKNRRGAGRYRIRSGRGARGRGRSGGRGSRSRRRKADSRRGAGIRARGAALGRTGRCRGRGGCRRGNRS